MPNCRHAVTVACSRKKIKLGALALLVWSSSACKHEPSALAPRSEAPATRASFVAPLAETAPLSPSVTAPPRPSSVKGAGPLPVAPAAGTSADESGTNGVFASRQACLGELAQARARATDERVRIASFNVRWFPFGVAQFKRGQPTDIEWLACVLAALNAPVVAVQEFTETNPTSGKLRELLAKLDELTHGKWSARFDGCPGRRRLHVGLLYDTAQVQAQDFRRLDAVNPKGGCAGQLRPGFAGYFKWPGGIDLHVVSVHLKAGDEKSSRELRRAAMRALPRSYAARQDAVSDTDVVFAGDFNVVGDRLQNAAHELGELQDKLSLDVPPFRFLSADAECSYLSSRAGSLLDFFVVPKAFEELPPGATVRVLGPCQQRCRTTASAQPARERLSDHCPIVLELDARDLD